VLKDSMKRWHLTASAPLPADLAVPGTVRTQVKGSEALLTVRGADADAIGEAERRLGATIQAEDLSLEDIFLEMHQ
jgi:hypothetical protein